MIRSPHPDVRVPDISVTSFVFERARLLGDKPALVDGSSGRTITYAGLVRTTGAVASNLLARGFDAGDVFAIFSPNDPDYAVAWHAVASLGGVTTTANPLLTADELARQLNDSGARSLLAASSFLDTALEAARRSSVSEVFVMGDDSRATSFADLCEGDAPLPEERRRGRDAVVLPYSSGTTGWPKGVELTHHNLVANLCQVAAVHKLSEGDTIIGLLPFFHIYGMTVVMNLALRAGATVITLPRFDLEQLLEVMQAYRVTRAHLVPPVLLALAKHPLVGQFDLSALTQIMSGAAPLAPEIAAACEQRLGCSVTQGYGLTETSPVTHLVPDDAPSAPASSIGPPVPSTECRVVDISSGEDCPAGSPGEIWVRGPQVMAGYLDNPAATEATVDREGWLHTGDLGYADDDGYFFIVDRLKELIKYKGFQVAPAELEALLLTHPAIADAAVVPLPDEDAGEVPKAFVVANEPVTPDGIMSFVAGRVAPHKRVRAVEIVESIPKSPSGKILRRVLKQLGSPPRPAGRPVRPVASPPRDGRG